MPCSHPRHRANRPVHLEGVALRQRRFRVTTQTSPRTGLQIRGGPLLKDRTLSGRLTLDFTPPLERAHRQGGIRSPTAVTSATNPSRASNPADQPRGKPLKVTIDSSEALADTLRVIGAVYNVTLAQVHEPPVPQARRQRERSIPLAKLGSQAGAPITHPEAHSNAGNPHPAAAGAQSNRRCRRRHSRLGQRQRTSGQRPRATLGHRQGRLRGRSGSVTEDANWVSRSGVVGAPQGFRTAAAWRASQNGCLASTSQARPSPGAALRLTRRLP